MLIPRFSQEAILRLKLKGIILSSKGGILLVVIDAVKLREINKKFGYPFGDVILHRISKGLESLGRGVVYGKYKGGTILGILKDVSSKEGEELLGRLYLKLKKEGISVRVGGLYLRGERVKDLDDVFERIDQILGKLKEENLNVFIVEGGEEKELDINVRDVFSALDEGRVLPALQRIYDVKEGKIFGYELLMRIRSKGGNLIPANSFIELLRRSGSLPLFEEVLMEKFLKHLKDRELKGYFFINLPAYFYDIPSKSLSKIAEFYEQIKALKRKPEDFVFEVSEKEKERNLEDLKLLTKNLRYFGFKLALDDFGLDSSSIDRLLVLRPDFVKLNSFFYKRDKRAFRFLANCLKRFANELILEEVEDEGMFKFARRCGIRLMQGFYLSEVEVLG